MIRVTVLGAAGRMGRMLVQQIAAAEDMQLAGATEVPGSPFLGQDAGTVAGLAPLDVPIVDDLAQALDTDAVIDFTAPANTLACAPKAVAAGAAVIIGTTGMTESDKAEIAKLVEINGRIVLAPNMSVGVNLLFNLCAKVAPLLGDDYDIEVVEMHHNRKQDAPSGTAVRLGEILAESTGRSYAADTVHGRVGQVGARTQREIGMHAVRGGDVVGDHTVIFATDGERVELTHKASSRETFAKGAVRAVRFLATAAPGIYDMQDVLGLK